MPSDERAVREMSQANRHNVPAPGETGNRPPNRLPGVPATRICGVAGGRLLERHARSRQLSPLARRAIAPPAWLLGLSPTTSNWSGSGLPRCSTPRAASPGRAGTWAGSSRGSSATALDKSGRGTTAEHGAELGGEAGAVRRFSMPSRALTNCQRMPCARSAWLQGDRVAMYLPMVPDVVMPRTCRQLARSFTPIFSGYSPRRSHRE